MIPTAGGKWQEIKPIIADELCKGGKRIGRARRGSIARNKKTRVSKPSLRYGQHPLFARPACGYRRSWQTSLLKRFSLQPGRAGLFAHLKLYRIRRRTAARAPLAPVLQFVAHVRQGLLTRGAGYLDGAECRTGMTNEPSAVPHSAESASCFHDGSPFWPPATTLGWPSSTFPLMPSARPRRSAHEQNRSSDREARPACNPAPRFDELGMPITAIVPAPVLWVK